MKYANVRDMASKIAENAARLAANFAILDGFPVVSIDNHSMESGCDIAEWHLDESLRYLGSRSAADISLQKMAEKFEKWAHEKCRCIGVSQLEKKLCLQNGPDAVSHDKDLIRVILFLANKHRARFSKDGRYVEINPALLNKPMDHRYLSGGVL